LRKEGRADRMSDDITEMFKDYPEVVTAEQIYNGMLPLSRKTIYDLLKSGRIRSLREGKKYLVPKWCVAEYVIKNMNLQKLQLYGIINLSIVGGCLMKEAKIDYRQRTNKRMQILCSP